MRIKFNFNINWRKTFRYVVLVIVTALLISSILIALPLTEKVSDRFSFNLNTKDSEYWSKEFIVRIETKEEKEIKRAREVFYKRLRNFGVENSTIFIEDSDDSSTRLRIVVNSTKDQTNVAQLIANRFDFRVVTRKSDVDFADESNPLTAMMAENYDPTEWDYSDFRSVYIPKEKLRTSGGDYRYFAIFKLWPKKNREINEFLKKKQGETIGIEVDKFVSPYQVPIFQEGSNRQESIIIGVNAESEVEAKVTSILYNSGHIPATYTIEAQNELTPQNISIDYIKVSIGLIISLIASYLFLFILKYDTKSNLIRSLFATVITLATYLSYIKLTHIPVDTFLLTICAILTMILIRALVNNRDSELYIIIGAVAILITISILGTGLMSSFAIAMIGLIALSKLSLIVTDWYIDNVTQI